METNCFETLRDLLCGLCQSQATYFTADGIRTEVKSLIDGRRYEVTLRPIEEEETPEYQQFKKMLE